MRPRVRTIAARGASAKIDEQKLAQDQGWDAGGPCRRAVPASVADLSIQQRIAIGCDPPAVRRERVPLAAVPRSRGCSNASPSQRWSAIDGSCV
jgi:hypothetical protein